MRALVIGGLSGQVARQLMTLNEPELSFDVRGRPWVDLAAPATLHAAFVDAKPDLVVCCGAYTAVDQAENEPSAAHAINANGPAVLSRMCASADVPIIFLSTDYVFDGTKASPYVESDLTAPQTVYGTTKLAGEAAVAASGARYVILRVSWVHAPLGNNFVRTMLRLARERDCIRVVADQIGRPTYAPHLALAIRDIAKRLVVDPSAPTGVFHLSGSGAACSWYQFAETIFLIAKNLGGPFARCQAIPTSAYPTLAKRPANSALDCSLIADAFGVRMPPWKRGAEECIELIRKGGWQTSQL